jgi:hypothetical protein
MCLLPSRLLSMISALTFTHSFWQTKSECLSDKNLYGMVLESVHTVTKKCPTETNVNA